MTGKCLVSDEAGDGASSGGGAAGWAHALKADELADCGAHRAAGQEADGRDRPASELLERRVERGGSGSEKERADELDGTGAGEEGPGMGAGEPMGAGRPRVPRTEGLGGAGGARAALRGRMGCGFILEADGGIGGRPLGMH